MAVREQCYPYGDGLCATLLAVVGNQIRYKRGVSSDDCAVDSGGKTGNQRDDAYHTTLQGGEGASGKEPAEGKDRATDEHPSDYSGAQYEHSEHLKSLLCVTALC